MAGGGEGASNPEFQAIKHWSNYGQRGAPSKERVLASDWQTEAFSKPVETTWDQAVPRTEVPKIINGFKPGAMEDKWFVYSDGPDANGKVAMYMYRSWTGYKLFEVEMQIEMNEEFEPADKDAKFTKIVYETDETKFRNAGAGSAKDMVNKVCNWCLGVQWPEGTMPEE
jgi:hypothetical protein